MAMFTPTEDMKGFFEFNMTATDTDREYLYTCSVFLWILPVFVWLP